MFDSAFRTASAAKLSGMNQVDTQVHDDPPEVNAVPKYWTRFAALHK